LPADTEVLSQLALDQMLALLQSAVHDQFHDGVVDRLAQRRRPLHPTRGPVGRRFARSLAWLAPGR
jgi:hypothetical protein